MMLLNSIYLGINPNQMLNIVYICLDCAIMYHIIIYLPQKNKQCLVVIN